jgi:hypothetical protein
MTAEDCHSFDTTQPGEVLIGIWTGGHDDMDSAIKFLTRRVGEHAGFIRGNGNIINNFYPRVNERGWSAGERATVEEYRIAGSTSEDWDRLETWFDSQLKNPPPYSIADLFRYAANMPPVHGAPCFCSQWVLRGLRLNLSPVLQPLVRLEYEDFAAPGDLRCSPMFIQRIKANPMPPKTIISTKITDQWGMP